MLSKDFDVSCVSSLDTEQRNKNTIGIEAQSTSKLLTMINDEDATVAVKVREAIPQIAKAVDAISERMMKGGRIVYVAAGTSGRLGFMDAAECKPTYGLNRVFCVMAGGHDAVFNAQESIEDSSECARKDLLEFGLKPEDTVIAASASGRTPYCAGGLIYGHEIGALCVSISCNTDAAISKYADFPIEINTGAESIMGSTRMKAGTAQKMVMNMISTSVMIRIGRTYDNLMIKVSAHNGKIGNRMIRLFNEATGNTDSSIAEDMIKKADGRLDIAVIMMLLKISKEKAMDLSEKNGGNLNRVLA